MLKHKLLLIAVGSHLREGYTLEAAPSSGYNWVKVGDKPHDRLLGNNFNTPWSALRFAKEVAVRLKLEIKLVDQNLQGTGSRKVLKG